MDYRSKILRVSLPNSDRTNTFICTSHCDDHLELVPVVAGGEVVALPPVPLQGPLAGTICDHWDDPNLIQEVKDRCIRRIRSLEQQNRLLTTIFGHSDTSDLDGVRENLAKLEELDGDQPVKLVEKKPALEYQGHMKEAFDANYGPSYVGKIVFIEVPLTFDMARDDGTTESGEYIIVQQTADSLYGFKTTCCLAGSGMKRLPFSKEDSRITILDAYEDDDFVREFIDRLDDMDTDTYEDLECDFAETASHQLNRMLQRKSQETKALDRLFSTAFFGPIGTVETCRETCSDACRETCEAK